MKAILLALLSLCFMRDIKAMDANSNQQSDIWEIQFGALSLAATTDHDHDGYTNAIESLAGTNPLDAGSYPLLEVASGPPGQLQLNWSGEFGKKIQPLPEPGFEWLKRGTLA